MAMMQQNALHGGMYVQPGVPHGGLGGYGPSIASSESSVRGLAATFAGVSAATDLTRPDRRDAQHTLTTRHGLDVTRRDGCPPPMRHPGTVTATHAEPLATVERNACTCAHHDRTALRAHTRLLVHVREHVHVRVHERR